MLIKKKEGKRKMKQDYEKGKIGLKIILKIVIWLVLILFSFYIIRGIIVYIYNTISLFSPSYIIFDKN